MQPAEKQITATLKKNNLSVTESRRHILQLFFQQKGALAHGDIEKLADKKFDRVTLYRTLQAFVEKGIIHSIPTADNAVRYALCKENCSEGHHHDRHIHFICNTCHQVFCLDDVVTPEVKLPGGYAVTQIAVVVEGVCKQCNHQLSGSKK